MGVPEGCVGDMFGTYQYRFLENLFHESLDSLVKNIVKIRIISEHSHVECNITILHKII